MTGGNYSITMQTDPGQRNSLPLPGGPAISVSGYWDTGSGTFKRASGMTASIPSQ